MRGNSHARCEAGEKAAIISKPYLSLSNLPGPENSAAVYELVGDDRSQFLTVLRYGFPVNPALSEGLSDDDRAWNAYITRLAVAYISRPNATWGGLTGETEKAVDDRVNGRGGAEVKANAPAITVNGMVNIEEDGDAPESPSFTLGHNRRTNCHRNPFRFEWTQGTPAGTRLYVDGNYAATAPANPSGVFTANDPFDIFMLASEFHFVLPSGSEKQTAGVNLVGINNQYAGRVYLMQNPNNAAGWQDIIFYVPEALASAAYTWDFEPEDEYGALRIVKRSQRNNRGLAGAVFSVTDSSGSPVSGSPFTTPSSGMISVTNLPEGVYTITETSPPSGYYLSSPATRTASVVAGQTAAVEVLFVNPPENGNGNYKRVFIEKVDALSRENVPNSTHPGSGALIRLQGMSSMTIVAGDGQSVTFNNTGVNLSQVLTANAQVAPPGVPGVTSTVGDGWWALDGLPYGFYSVEEERAPDGFSLLPQHTAYSFWLHPPDVTIALNVIETEVVIPWDDVLAMLQSLSGANTPANDLQAVLNIMTSALGAVELVVIPVYDIEQNPHSNAVHIIFENYPFSEIVAYKHCIVTNQPLAGAHIRVQGFFAEGNAPQTIDHTLVTDSSGRVVFHGLPAGQYTVSEVQAPSGFLIDDPGFHSVSVSWGQIANHPTRPAPVVRFYNTPMSYLEVLKIDGDITGDSPTGGQPLAGARFRLTGLDAQDNRVSWYATSGSNGIASFDGPLVPGETYILEEVQAPDGFVIMDGESAIVMSPGRNTVTWRNWRNPGLTIIKTDQDTGARLAGAEFTIQAQGSGSPLPTDFPLITDSNGAIHVPWTLFEGEPERTFIITEVVPPPGYHLADPNWQAITMIAGHDNTVVFQNRRMPTITVDKRDSVTGEPIEGAYFNIEKVDDPGRGPVTGNPFRTNVNGQIVLPFQHAGMYRITEVNAAQNYWFDPLEQNRSWIIHVRPNEDYLQRVENTLLPTLVITKWNMVTMRSVPLTHYRVELEVPNSPNVVNIGDFVTDRNGQIILPFVDVGWYRVTEIFPAPGMALNLNNNYRVFLNPGDNTYRLLSYLRGGNNSSPRVSDAGIGEFSTNENPSNSNSSEFELPQTVQAVADFPFTPAEWETMNYSARQQFLQSQISVTDGSQWLAPGGQNVFNWPLNSIVIKKTCSVTGQLLPGATFNLIHTSAGTSGTLGTVVGTYTTGPSGIIVITGLVPGSYIVREETPPQHFTLSVNNTQTAFLAPDGHTVVELNFANDPYGSLLITKRCEVTHRPLQHAEFRVTRSDGSVVGTSNGLFSTNAQGYILIPNLPPDSYVATEMRAPDGFQIDRVPQTIRVNASGQTYQLNFTNIPYSTLIIRKLDSYNMTPLPGARFDVRYANGEWIGEFVTDSNGLIEVQELLGWVTISETDPPPGFALDPNPTRTVQVSPRAPSVVTFLNPRLGSLTIEKTDQHGAPLAGAQFRVSHQNGQLVGYHTTGASGMINISNLPSGFFFVEEVRAPQGFVISEAGRSVEVGSNSAAHVTFVNLEVPSLSIVKIDQDSNPLSGARFRVTEIGGSFREYVTTGQGGLASMILPVGTFEIVEVQAPAGFVVTEPARTFVASAGEHRIETFVNHRIPSIVIEKVDTEGRPLQGAEFEIRHMDGGLVQRVVTNNGGVATVAQIEPGIYQVVESRAPQGFVPDSNAQIATVVAGETVTLRFVNERIPSLVIEKVCTEGNPLANAEFEIRTLDGALISRGTTNQGGMFIVAELEPGAYEILETRTPAGFVVTEPSRVVQVAAGQSLTERFVNHRAPALIIEKVCENGEPLSGAEFEIRRMNGELVHRVVTGNGGLAIIDELAPDAYQITETRPPEGFAIVEPSRAIEIVAGETRTERFVNPRLATFVINKIDGVTGEPLQGVVFEITTLEGEHVRNPATGSFEFTTDSSGLIRLPMLPAGSYVATETRPLQGFRAAEPYVFVVGHDRNYIITIRNYRYPDYNIRKLDGHTDQPMQGVQFEIATFFANGSIGERLRNPLDGSFVWTTDHAGLIRIPNLPHGTYVATETRTLPGFKLAEPIVFVVDDFELTTLTVRNYRYSDWNIRKLSGDTGEPLAGVVFEISHFFGTGTTGDRLRNPLDGSFEFVTNAAGIVHLGALEPGTFLITETRPLPGYINAEPVVFTVEPGADDTTVTIRNYKQPSIVIRKICGDTGQALAGVEFEIAVYLGNGRTGQRLKNYAVDNSYTFTTDASGHIYLPTLENGVYIATETRALPGFKLAAPVTFTVGANGDHTVIIRNYREADFIIRKTDGDTGRPLAGVHFEIASYFGSGNSGERLRNPVDGSTTFVTDAAGLISLPSLEPGTYIAVETRALDGFILAEPVIFVVGESAENSTIDIQNFRAPNLTIRKINSVTRQPIQGVVFQIASISGERVTNPQTGFFDFTTDQNGLIHLPAMEDGTFLVTEIRAAQGYFGLDEAVVLNINSQTRQQDYLLVVENTPASGLRILKTDANTGAPLQGVEFEVRHADGRLVRGQMADQNQPGTHANSPNVATNDNFLTDHSGMLHLNHLEAGVYHITETRALPGYLLDSTVHVVTITPGILTTLEVVNAQMAGLRLHKIDSVTRQGIQGVEFRIFDFITNQEVAGPFITDNEGIIDFTGILPAGRYTIRETREAPGYLRDTMPRTIELRSGMITEIQWENTREAGQVQITKLSSADNQVNGLPSGSRLEGAVFEVRDWRTGNVIDQFITDARGVGVSRPLPLGRYLIEEIVAPAFYRRSDVVLDVTIEHSGQILRYEFTNEPANVGVEVRKNGPVEVMAGQPIIWNITTIANSSTIELSDFYVRDILPAHAVRLDRIFTGTFNQSLRYSVMFRTNQNDTWRVAFDNLLSTSNNALIMSPAALGLGSNEFVTEIMYSFGTVRAGFRSVEAPRIEGTVRDGLQNGYEFVNRIDIGGRTGSEWVVGNNLWVSRVFRPSSGRHPRTGW